MNRALFSACCGDGIRDATPESTEECDDGLATNPDLRTDRCQVRSLRARRRA